MDWWPVQSRLTGISTLFHVQHCDDVTSDDFYAASSTSEAIDTSDVRGSAHDHGSNPGSTGSAADAETEPWIEPDDISGVRKALIAYRVMAYLVGTFLVVLVCVAMPLKYAAGRPTMVNIVGVSHGWLYPVLLITAYILGRKAGWPLTRLLIIALAGTVPFLSFVAEHFARKDVDRRIDQAKDYWAHHEVPAK
ncbi:DUF3817 domain-containing protein [Cutibacterium avidum]|uniref:DUF3817 domain-containing protein n=1 Tax=Cutibacterium avidum TaxID=33010 RepID=A0AB35XLJ0_9ACTN|nr:DUF3817 domain-containing protein [Cutibacterium avidum]MDU5516025.1 DUF3817 domain-containing protein [Cutibacterium avidum]